MVLSRAASLAALCPAAGHRHGVRAAGGDLLVWSDPSLYSGDRRQSYRYLGRLHLHYLSERRLHHGEESPLATALRLRQPLTLALVTTLLGYLLLWLTPFPGLQQRCSSRWRD